MTHLRSGIAAAAIAAIALTAIGTSPVSGCVEYLGVRRPSEVRLFVIATIVRRDPNEDPLARIDVTYIGPRLGTVTLTSGGGCGFPYERLTPGTRVALLFDTADLDSPSYSGPWLYILDGDRVAVEYGMNTPYLGSRDLGDILHLVGLPDASVLRVGVSAATVAGVSLVSTAVLWLALSFGTTSARRRGRAWNR